jgi:SpoIID/LytB domain protein
LQFCWAENLSTTLVSMFRLQLWTGGLSTALAATCWIASMAESGLSQEAPLNPQLDIGVVQRFGSDSKDEITLKPEPGDQITLTIQTEAQPQTATQPTTTQSTTTQTITTRSDVKVDVVMEPLPQPKVNERVVLSTHRSFESAEDSADRWKNKGIEVEIAQPRQWQVWAKRDTYRSPLLRRLLMQNLQAHGSRTAFLDTQIQRQEPKAALTVNGNRYQQDQVEIVSSQPVAVTFNREDHGTKVYAGSFKLQPNAYGTYTLVNKVPLETYLRGVVPHEIGPGAPVPAIEAQAVLARTYALRNLRRFTVDNYQLCADTQCQVYWGLTHPDTLADRAITATRGMVLTYQNELVDALYSSTTGGVTARFTDVWDGVDRPYLQSVVDSVQNSWDLVGRSLSDEQNFRAFIAQKAGFNEAGWDMFRWQVVSPLADITRELRSYLQSNQHPLANFTQVQDLKVVERSPAGRVQKLAITTDRGVIELEKDEILRALYAPNSTLFYIDPVFTEPNQAKADPQNPVAQVPSKLKSIQAPTANPAASAKVLTGFAFTGGGLGHGVGMSQTGSYHLGEIGWSSTRILSFYYPGTQLKPLTGAITFWREPTSAATAQPSMRSLLLKQPNLTQLNLTKSAKTTRP